MEWPWSSSELIHSFRYLHHAFLISRAPTQLTTLFSPPLPYEVDRTEEEGDWTEFGGHGSVEEHLPRHAKG